MTAVHQKSFPYGFAVLAGLILAACSVLAMLPALASYRETPLMLGMAVDLMVVLPAVFYVLVVRPRAWPLASMIPFTLACIAVASYLIPSAQYDFMQWTALAVATGEAAAVTYLVIRIRRILFSYRHSLQIGFVERMSEALGRILGHHRATEIIATEVSIARYGLFAFLPAKEVPGPAFSYHRRSGYHAIMVAVLVLMVVELVPMHILVARWSTTAALALTILTVYGIVFLIADWKAIVCRPLVVTDNTLFLRTGMRWRAEIPLPSILDVQITRSGAPAAYAMSATAARNTVLTFREPIRLTGLYGLQKAVTSVALFVDEPVSFTAALHDKKGQS